MEGWGGGTVAVFVFGTSLISSGIHSCTYAESGLQANADMRAYSFTTRRQKVANEFYVHKLSWIYTHFEMMRR